MARRRLPDLADDQRCTRNGTNWRCHLPRLPGKSYCQKHQLFNLARSQSKSKTKSQSPFVAPVSSFNLREIWAFDNPRLYGRVERLIPAQSSVEITPLISHPTPSLDAACGFFRPAESVEVRDMAGFSHRVWFETEGDELYKIVPMKGEIWAVQMYGWVEMVTSFSEREGGSGAVLVEDEGGVFRRKLHDGCELMRRFLAGELWMFMHRVSGARVAEGYQGMLESCTLAIEGPEESQSREVTICIQSEACGTSIGQATVSVANEGEIIASRIIGGEIAVTIAGDSIMENGDSHQTADAYKVTEGENAATEAGDSIMENGDTHQTSEAFKIYEGENAVTVAGDSIMQNGDCHQTAVASNAATEVGDSSMNGDYHHTVAGSKIDGENAATVPGDFIMEYDDSYQTVDVSEINEGENAVSVVGASIMQNCDYHQTVDGSNEGEDAVIVRGDSIMETRYSHQTVDAFKMNEGENPATELRASTMGNCASQCSHQTVYGSEINGENAATVARNSIMQNGGSYETSEATYDVESIHPVEGVILKYAESDSAVKEESNQQDEVCSRKLQDVREVQLEQL